MTFREALQQATAQLGDRGPHNARMEAVWLLSHTTGLSNATLLLGSDRWLDAIAWRRFRGFVNRRSGGEPLQYIIGSTEFFGITIETGPGVFIPRPETECLVEKALELDPGTGALCDLCTGSAAVALALSLNFMREVQICATEKSPAAIAYARRNIERLGCRNVTICAGDLFAGIPREHRFGLITANPPYVSPRLYDRLADEVRLYEPSNALLCGQEGVELVARIVAEAGQHLEPGGRLLCEISPEQAERVAALFRRNGYIDVAVFCDYTGRKRVVAGRLADTAL